MSELEQQIAAIIGECVHIRRVSFTGNDVLGGIDESARRIAALPPITAETVRRVLDAMGGLIGSGAKPDDWLNYEAIAHRANQQEK